MKKEFLECGEIVNTHGIKGEVKIYPWCDEPEMFVDIETLYLKSGEMPLEVEQARLNKNMVLCKIKGYDTVEAAAKLRGKTVFAHRKDIPIEEGEHFVQDLIGLAVFDADTGEKYGHVVDVTETGANSVYHIEFANKEVKLAPSIPDVILSIDIEQGNMQIRPLKGLFTDED